MGEFDSKWNSKIFAISEANKPFRLLNDDIPDAEFVLQADPANIGTIRICSDYGVVAGGFALFAGQTVSLPIPNMNLIYVAGDTQGDKINLLYAGGLGRRQRQLAEILKVLQALAHAQGVKV